MEATTGPDRVPHRASGRKTATIWIAASAGRTHWSGNKAGTNPVRVNVSPAHCTTCTRPLTCTDAPRRYEPAPLPTYRRTGLRAYGNKMATRCRRPQDVVGTAAAPRARAGRPSDPAVGTFGTSGRGHRSGMNPDEQRLRLRARRVFLADLSAARALRARVYPRRVHRMRARQQFLLATYSR
jgi:ribosomal protein L34E